ncbi:hypothetical protein SAMN02746041_02477 [Desulfacinum hydrothermale DSM 13146]|uniref:Uncharacterized protein n=1 Tax=Desulfacinum hydrothermale DSM 13146 TaxID=1121390 RepID=A0A1W1XQ20_9BACT|nr:hypothetical protein [Desulfacinum hydrothermale]SMC25967.1 hypothetical protein SAMN02746041_02477 [Desulfacinum hydrothermale DSM 13146]
MNGFRWLWALAVGVMVLWSPAGAQTDDPIYVQCRDEVRAPWCYQEAVEKREEPELCENILRYWPNAAGVHGWCYYRLAWKKRDCSLCKPIVHDQVKALCRREVCR